VNTKYRGLIFLENGKTIEMLSHEEIKKHTAKELNSDFDWYYYKYEGQSITVKVRPESVQAVIQNVREE